MPRPRIGSLAPSWKWGVRARRDVIKSNYHYRTAVLKMRPTGSWARGDYEFPKERAESYVRFYWSWRRFEDVRPVLHVRYEDLNEHTSLEIRRILDFLGIEGVTDERIQCAVNASTMDKLKDGSNGKRVSGTTADQFFGSRGNTEAREKLDYPDPLLDHFESVGLFDVRQLLGYGSRPLVTNIDDAKARRIIKTSEEL